MDSYNRQQSYSSPQSFAPSAPSLPENHSYGGSPPADYRWQQQQQRPPYQQPAQSSYGGGYGQDSNFAHGASSFPAGTHPDVIRSFQMVDRDRSGYIDDKELQQALCSGYQRFSIGTIRLLMFLFKNPHDPLRIGIFSISFSFSIHKASIFEYL